MRNTSCRESGNKFLMVYLLVQPWTHRRMHFHRMTDEGMGDWISSRFREIGRLGCKFGLHSAKNNLLASLNLLETSFVIDQ